MGGGTGTMTERGPRQTRRAFHSAALAAAGSSFGILGPGCSRSDLEQFRHARSRVAGKPSHSAGMSLGARRVFPDDNPWNRDVSGDPVDPASPAILARVGLKKPLHPDFGTVFEGAENGIPYVVVDGSQPR